MEPEYPLFIVDLEGWMDKVESEIELNYKFEEIDIEDDENSGWDIKARPIHLFVEDKIIKCKLRHENPEKDNLRKAINNYGRLLKIVIENYGLTEESLFDEIEHKYKESRFLNKYIFTFISRIKKRIGF